MRFMADKLLAYPWIFTVHFDFKESQQFTQD